MAISLDALIGSLPFSQMFCGKKSQPLHPWPFADKPERKNRTLPMIKKRPIRAKGWERGEHEKTAVKMLLKMNYI